MLYKVFIDDSGNKDYQTPFSKEFIDNPPVFEKYEEFWRQNYFVLCAVRIAQEDIGEINSAINILKTFYFKTHEVEIKSDWLRNPHQRRKHYLDKFLITEDQLTEFVEHIYEVLQKNSDKIKLIAVVFDKRYYGDKKRQSNEGNPLLKTSQIIFERLQYLNTYHVVVFDQMESSLKINKGLHGKILNVLSENKEMDKIFVTDYDRIIDVNFIESHKENFLQIADLCAYNVFRQFVHHGREWAGKIKNSAGKAVMETYPYFDKIRCNFIHLPKFNLKKVCGIGLICLPDADKCQWDLLHNCNI